jgi:rhodanese-related sulfurtransferase
VVVIAPWFDGSLADTSAPFMAALVLGIAFGWALERAGLGSARKLMGQFYLTDLTVFKVMFSAIVTAMLGAFWLGRLGLLDLSRVYVPETFVVPQLAGGLIFGAGFAIAGLCPGTSCVAAATGRGDGLATVGGMFAGVLLTGLFFEPLKTFYDSTPRGAFTLPQAFGVPYGVVVVLVVAVAIGGFALAERIEARPSSRSRPVWWLGAVVGGAALVAPVAGSPYIQSSGTIDVAQLASIVAREDDHVTAIELAEWIRDRKPGLRVIDVRPEAEFASFHLPTATNVPIESLPASRFAPTDTVVVYSGAGGHAAQAWVFLRALGHERAYFLRGGLAEWVDEVLNPTRASSASPEEIARFDRIAALSRYFGGVPRVVDRAHRSGHDESRAEANERGGTASVPATGTPTSAEIARLRRRGC